MRVRRAFFAGAVSVNYYERYCGDYAKKTARLTLMQHGAYTLLLDEYYSTEQPLPADMDELFRLCRAMSKPEQDAVYFIADRFFPVSDDGMRHNDRADEMIEKARPKMDAARANGKKGGRPPKNPLGSQPDNPAETQREPDGKPTGFLFDNPVDNPAETHGQTTRARSPTPTPVNLKTLSSPSRDDVEPSGFDRFWNAWPTTERKVAKAKCAERWKKARLDSVVQAIVEHVDAMRDSRQWREGYEPAPLTYLNQRRWEDEVVVDSAMNGHTDNVFG